MAWSEFLPLFAAMVGCMYLMRIVPISVLSDRALSPRTERLLGYIPAAAFAALVANDLLFPGMFDAGLWPAVAPLLASAAVLGVAIKTRSMVWCIVVGVALYAAMVYAL